MGDYNDLIPQGKSAGVISGYDDLIPKALPPGPSPEFMARQQALSDEAKGQNTKANIFGFWEKALEPISVHGLVSQPTRLYNKITGSNLADPTPLVTPKQGQSFVRNQLDPALTIKKVLALVQGKPIPMEMPAQPPGSVGEGMQQAFGGVISGATAPENALFIPAFLQSQGASMVSQIMKALLAGQMAHDTSQGAIEGGYKIANDPKATGGDVAKLGAETLLGGLFSGLVGKHVLPETVRSGIGPGDTVSKRFPSDMLARGVDVDVYDQPAIRIEDPTKPQTQAPVAPAPNAPAPPANVPQKVPLTLLTPEEMAKQQGQVQPQQVAPPAVAQPARPAWAVAKETGENDVPFIRGLRPVVVVGGRRFYGKVHNEAIDRARAAGLDVPQDNEKMRAFEDVHGNLYSRTRAAKKAQLPVTRLHSEDLLKSAGQEVPASAAKPKVEPAPTPKAAEPVVTKTEPAVAPAEPIESDATIAERVIKEEGKASVTLLQRRNRWDYARAKAAMADLERRGVVGAEPGDGSARKVSPVTPEAKPTLSPVEDTTRNMAERPAYDTLQAQLDDIPRRIKAKEITVEDAFKQTAELRAKIEDIKSRNKGMPPGEVTARVEPPVEKPTSKPIPQVPLKRQMERLEGKKTKLKYLEDNKPSGINVWQGAKGETTSTGNPAYDTKIAAAKQEIADLEKEITTRQAAEAKGTVEPKPVETSPTKLPQWKRQLAEQGFDIDNLDMNNPNVREAIRIDPNLTEEQKTQARGTQSTLSTAEKKRAKSDQAIADLRKPMENLLTLEQGKWTKVRSDRAAAIKANPKEFEAAGFKVRTTKVEMKEVTEIYREDWANKKSITRSLVDKEQNTPLIEGGPDTSKLFSGLPVDPTTIDKVVKDLAFTYRAPAKPIFGDAPFEQWDNAKAEAFAEKPKLPKGEKAPKITETPLGKLILNNPKAHKLNAASEIVAQPGKRLTFGERVKNVFAKPIAKATETELILNPQDVVMDELDGGYAKYDGPVMQLRKMHDDKYNESYEIVERMSKPVRELIEKHKIDDLKSARIDTWLKAMEPGGYRRMIQSGVRMGEINHILANITPAELEVARAMRQVYDEIGPVLQRVARKVDGIKINIRENFSPWNREWRTYKPDADELAINPKLQSKMAKGQGVSPEDVIWAGVEEYAQGRTIPGSLEERKVGAKTPIRLDAVAGFQKYLRDSIHYITHRELLKQSAKLVRHNAFAETYGGLGQKLMMEYLNSIARQGRYARIEWIDTLRRHTSVGVIAFRLPSQFVHLANIPLAMHHAGPMWWYKGFDELIRNPNIDDFLHKNFAETFARGGGEAALAELAEAHTRTKIGADYVKVQNAGFWTQRTIDRANAQATVLGIYMRLLKEKGLDPNRYAELPVDKAAVQQARVLARRAVASPIYKDLPPILTRGGSVAKTAFQFQTTFLDQWSNVRHDLIRAGLGHFAEDPTKAMKMLVAVTGMLMSETAVKYGYKQVLHGVTGEEERESDTYQKDLMNESLKRVPMYSQIASQLMYGQTGVPALDVILGPAKQLGIMMGSKDESQSKLARTKMISSGLEALGVPGTSQITDFVASNQRGKYYRSHEKRLEDITHEAPGFMPIDDRIEAERKLKESRPPLDRWAKIKSAEADLTHKAQHAEDLEKTLSKADRGWITSRKLELPGYENRFEIGGQQVYLTREELKQYGAYVKEEYETAIKEIRADKSFDEFDDEGKRIYFSQQMSYARNAARSKMIDEMESVSKFEKNPARTRMRMVR